MISSVSALFGLAYIGSAGEVMELHTLFKSIYTTYQFFLSRIIPYDKDVSPV